MMATKHEIAKMSRGMVKELEGAASGVDVAMEGMQASKQIKHSEESLLG